MKRNAATLLELIFVIIIVSFLATATFKGMQAIMVRAYKAKETTKLSLESQIIVNEISNYLQYRVPYTVIGYNANNGDFQYIGDIINSDKNLSILEWFGIANEVVTDGNCSGFADMATLSNNSFLTQGTNGDNINTSIKKKFNINSPNTIYTDKIVNLIFAGSFDRATSDTNEYNSSFGWHGNNSNDSFDINIAHDGNITLTDTVKPKFIYEKYFLVDTTYAIARGVDIQQNAPCIESLHVKQKEMNDTLFLFSNYRPWKGETFCADKSGTQAGNVSILMQNIDGFKFEELDYTIRINLDINKTIRGASPIHFSKMKVVF